MTQDRRGFTLLELIVAASIVAAAAVVVAGAFAAGLKIFDRTRQLGGYGESVVALEVMQKDLHNAAPFRLKGFRGERAWIEIPMVMQRQAGAEGGECPGVVRYEIGPSGHALDRVTTLYASPEQPVESRETLISSLDEVRFSFGETGPDGTSPVSWLEEWNNPTNLPAVVKMVIDSNKNGEHLESSRTVVLSRR